MLAAGLFLTVALQAQDKQEITVPQKVKNKMLAMHPQTQEVPVVWTKEGDNYKGSLLFMGTPGFLVFDSTGRVIRSEQRILPLYVPKPVLETLKAEDPNYVIKEVIEITSPGGKKSYHATYQVTRVAVFNADGTLVKDK